MISLLIPLIKKPTFILSALIVWSVLCYQVGARTELRKMAREAQTTQTKALKEERKRGVEGVRRAAQDVSRINELEKSNEELTRKLDEIANRPLCPIDDDSLRILEEVRRSTERK
jgi:hypothetical protein